jgi:hypothetical protein
LATAADENVVSVAAVEAIVAASRADPIVPRIADQLVVVAGTNKYVVIGEATTVRGLSGSPDCGVSSV